MRKSLYPVLCATFALFVFGLSAQETESPDADMGLIRGSITDASGRATPIAGATIEYTGPRGYQGEVTSDQEGNYLIPNLMPGRYTINVTAEGYSPRTNLMTSVLEGRESLLPIPLHPKPNLLGRLKQSPYALVALGFALGLLIGVAAALMIRGRESTGQGGRPS